MICPYCIYNIFIFLSQVSSALWIEKKWVMYIAALTKWPLRNVEVILQVLSFKLILWIDILSTTFEIDNGCHRISQHWCRCHEAVSHCLNQCWPGSMSPWHVASPGHTKLTHFDLLPHKFIMTNKSHFSVMHDFSSMTWWHHQMETFSALLALCAGNSLVSGEFPAQRLVTWTFDVFSGLRLNTRFSKQSWGRWFGMLSCSLWRNCNDVWMIIEIELCWNSVIVTKCLFTKIGIKCWNIQCHNLIICPKRNGWHFW